MKFDQMQQQYLMQRIDFESSPVLKQHKNFEDSHSNLSNSIKKNEKNSNKSNSNQSNSGKKKVPSLTQNTLLKDIYNEV